MNPASTELRLADRIWLAVAALQQRFPNAAFSRFEIRQELDQSGLSSGMNSASVNAHLKQHLVANVPPSTSKYIMLFETKAGFLRLYRPGDLINSQRALRRRSKHMPRREEIPSEYHPLLDWYEEWCQDVQISKPISYEDDPLIKLIGSGKHIWADEHADEYVNNLRREDV